LTRPADNRQDPGTTVARAAVAMPAGPAHASLRPAPGRREMALIAGLAFFLNLSLGLFLLADHPRLGLVVSEILFVAGPALLGVHWFLLERRDVLPLRRPAAGALGGALLGALGLNHLLMIYGAWQESVWPTPEIIQSWFAGLFVWRGGADFALTLLSFAAVPAVCEEVLFRGYVQAGLRRHGSGRLATILASAAIFCAFHLSPWRAVPIFVLGAFLAWVREVAGSLWPAIAAHALNNALSIGLAAAGLARDDRALFTPVTLTVAIACVTAAILLVAAASRASRSAASRVL